MFQGYSQETVDFMWGIRFNNERGWFLAHKDDYQQHLLAPTRELGQAVYDGLAAALPHEPLILKVSRSEERRVGKECRHRGAAAS